MNASRGLLHSVAAKLPQAPLLRGAAAFFSLAVFTLPVSLSVSQACLGVAGVLYAVHLVRAGWAAAVFPPVLLPIGFYSLFTVLSVLWATNQDAGWLAVRKLVLLVILLLTPNLVVRRRHLEWLFKGLFVTGAAASLVAIGQFIIQLRAVRVAHPGRVYDFMTAQRITGFMGHWMNFGGQQMLVFAALLAFLLLAPRTSGGRGRRIVGWVLMGVVALAIVLNFTRGVWLGCFLAAVYLVARWKPRWLWALPVLVALGLVAAPGLVRERINMALHPWQDPALSIRFEMWQVGGRMVARHPWLGVGPNDIPQVYDLYLLPGQPARPGYHDHLHDNVIQIAAERGLPCLAAWLWLMLTLVIEFWRLRRRWGGSPAGWVLDAALAGWLAFVLEGFFEYNFGTSPVLMLFLFVASTPFVVERLERERPA